MFAEVLSIYKRKPDFKEGMLEIYGAVTARSLNKLFTYLSKMNALTQKDKDEMARLLNTIVERVNGSDRIDHSNHYTWLLKGFFEISQREWLLQSAFMQIMFVTMLCIFILKASLRERRHTSVM